jgi:hypothetical protein
VLGAVLGFSGTGLTLRAGTLQTKSMLGLIAEKITESLGSLFMHFAAEQVVTNREVFIPALTHSIVFRSRPLRVSMAQILSIKIDDKFLLIRSRRRSQYGPIGGVVRYFRSEASRLEGEIGFTPESKAGEDKYDLRGQLRGDHFARFLRWYATGAGRESATMAREIEEEFIEIGIPEIADHVRRPEFVRDRLIHEGPSEIRDRDYWQYRAFEVLSLREEADVSKRLADFIRTQAAKNPDLTLVSIADIKRGHAEGLTQPIGDSAGYLFSDAAHGIRPPPLV